MKNGKYIINLTILRGLLFSDKYNIFIVLMSSDYKEISLYQQYDGLGFQVVDLFFPKRLRGPVISTVLDWKIVG